MKFVLNFLLLLLVNAVLQAQASDAHSSSQFIATAQHALTMQLKKQSYTKLYIRPLSKHVVTKLSLAQVKIDIKDRYPPLKQTCVRLYDNQRSIPIWFKISAYQPVLVAKHRLKSRSIVNANDFILKNKDIAGLKNRPYQQLPAQTWLKKSLNAGTIVTEEHLILKPDVVSGQRVHVHIRSPGISIDTEAIAQHDSYQGTMVKLQHAHANKSFMARVVAPDHVEVDA